MAKLETRDQVLAHLARMSSTETDEVHPVTGGSVATKVLTPEQMTSGA